MSGAVRDVECSHRQLRSWFADRLSGNNSTASAIFTYWRWAKIPSVTHSANARDRIRRFNTDRILSSLTPMRCKSAAIFSSMSWLALTIFFFLSLGPRSFRS